MKHMGKLIHQAVYDENTTGFKSVEMLAEFAAPMNIKNKDNYTPPRRSSNFVDEDGQIAAQVRSRYALHWWRTAQDAVGHGGSIPLQT